MELRQIQYFICLYEDGTVTAAARRLNIVQPALSMQIARIEEELGVKLFERSKQGMMPTEAARQMYRLYLPIMRDFSQARDQVMSTRGEVSGHVNVGLIASITEGVLTETLSAFSAKYPHVHVTIADGYSVALTDWVSGGQIEAAIINKPRKTLALNVEHIVDEELVLVTSAAQRAEIPVRLSLKQVSALGLSMVLPTRHHGLRSVIDNFAQQEELDLAPVLEVDSLVTIVKLVERSQMATILPRIAVHQGLAAGLLRAHAISSPRLVRKVVSISHPRRPLSSATTAFIAMLSDQIRLRAREQTLLTKL